MNNQNDIQQVELSLEQAKKIVAFGDAIDRLGRNRDFQKVIEEGYFKDEAVRLVFLASAPNLQSPEHQAAVNESIKAIGHFRQFLAAKLAMSKQARTDIEDYNETLEELRDEVGEEG